MAMRFLLFLLLYCQLSFSDYAEELRNEFDEYEMVAVNDVAITPARPGRLVKRGSGESPGAENEDYFIQFDTAGKRYIIVAREHPSLLDDQSIVRLHTEKPVEEKIQGKAFVGQRLIAIDINNN